MQRDREDTANGGTSKNTERKLSYRMSCTALVAPAPPAFILGTTGHTQHHAFNSRTGWLSPCVPSNRRKHRPWLSASATLGPGAGEGRIGGDFHKFRTEAVESWDRRDMPMPGGMYSDDVPLSNSGTLPSLQLPKARPRTPGCRDKSVTPAPLQHELSSTVRFAAWNEFHPLAEHCAENWKTKLEDVDPKDKRTIETMLSAAAMWFDESYKFKNDVECVAALTLRSLTQIEPYLDKMPSSEDSRSPRTSASSVQETEVKELKSWEVLRKNVYEISKVDCRLVPDPSGIAPDFGFFAPGGGRDGIPVANVEFRGPHKRLVHDDERGEMNSASAVAESHNKYFLNPEYVNGDSVRTPWYFHTIAQVIMSALHTRTGYAGLYNHNEAVFLKVSVNIDTLNSSQKAGGLTVEISQIYTCDGLISACHGILALLQSAGDVEQSTTRTSLQEGFCVLKMMNRRRKQKESRRNRGGGTDGTSSVASMGDQSMRRRIEKENHTELNKPQGEVNGLWKSQDDVVAHKEHWLFLEGSPYDKSEFISKVMCDYDEIVAEGASGKILQATVDSLAVAVKYWNRNTEEGRQWFINELDIIEYLLDTAPDLFGSVLPRVIAIQRDEPCDSVLVTEFVGEALEYRENQVFVEGVQMRGEEAKALREAGLSGMRKLHAAGVVHQDIRGPNLRVGRVVDEEGKVGWRVWILDLGLATRVFGEEEEEWDLAGIKACLGRRD